MKSRYDGHAGWYDAWAQADGAPFMAVAQAVLEELVPPGPGLAIDVGCGTGLHAATLVRRGFDVVGLDHSADQLRLARDRLPVVRGDGRALPFRSGSADLVVSLLTHTDLDRFDMLVAESVRVLAPGGVLVHVGVHPCFVHPFAEPTPDGLVLHEGYRTSGWLPTTPHTGNAVRQRVGVHHLTLESLLTAFLRPGARLDRVVERGNGAHPEILAMRLSRL